ncbi:UDP-glucose 4-epimerase GalE [Phosphitispora sp. TUW77]|uniref:UDP-glucose 4-epimerase GalE n=1 Tax=Phosphitispora sp. TUW77 TaxID=3152361 RepID=UPI003AB25D37
MRVLVTGGAGYIGSHTVRELMRNNNEVVILDNLCKGHRSAVPRGVPFEEGDIADRALVQNILRRYGIEAVMHFAAFSLVGESMEDPAPYFRNNTVGSLALLETLVQNNIKKVIFSSTAAVYGEPEHWPVTENDAKAPTNNYGLSKLMIEEILRSFDRAYGLNYVSLRYFNAAGAHISGEIGEDHDPETHLIPLVLQTALGQRESIKIFGTDYPTPDGTCVRDYIHVTDLANAHVLALEYLDRKNVSNIFNLGNGEGFSVRQVIDSAVRVTGRKITVVEAERRAGDPAILVAGSDRIKQELGWKPEYTGIDAIVAAAWKWHLNHPEGFGDRKQK